MSMKYHDNTVAGMLGLDTTPVAGSGNAVTSGGIYTEFSKRVQTRTLTSAQYAALSTAEKNLDIVYFITDDNIDPNLATTAQLTAHTGDSTIHVTAGQKSVWDNRVLAVATKFAIPTPGSSVSYNLTGLTADHELVRWNFTDGSTVIAENSPPCDISWTTYNGYFTISNTNGTTSASCKPVFALPTAVATTAHT